MAWDKKNRPGNWKKGPDPTVDFLDLLPLLLRTKTQAQDQPLYQLLKDLISKTNQNKDLVNSILNSFFGNIRINDVTDLQSILIAIAGINSILQNATFWTESDESLNLPSSRQVLAGLGITLDYSVANKITISATGAGGMCYIPLATGTEPLTFMSDGNGQPFLIPFVQ